jgi:septal ring factor EnvC (AmiA/AmiB activator)
VYKIGDSCAIAKCRKYVYDVRGEYFAVNGGSKMSDQKASYGDASIEKRVDRVEERLSGVEDRLSDVEKRLSHVEGSQLAIIHSQDEMRAENASQFAELRRMIGTVIESQHVMAEMIRSLQPPTNDPS